MGARLRERGKGFVRRHRHQRRHDAGLLQLGAVLVDVDIVGEPDLDAAADRLVGAREIQEGAPGREIGVDQGGEGKADEELQAVAGRLEEGVDLDVGRDVMGGGRRCHGPYERADERRGNLPNTFETAHVHAPLQANSVRL